MTNFFFDTISHVVFFKYAVRMNFLENALLAHGECPYHIITEAAAVRFGILDDPGSGRPGYVRLSAELRFVTPYGIVCLSENLKNCVLAIVAVTSLMEYKCQPALVETRRTEDSIFSPSGLLQ